MKVTDNITGGHVTHGSGRYWRCKYTQKQRMNQLKYHTDMVRVLAEDNLPKGTRFIVAIRGSMENVEDRMETCYQVTAEMQFEPEWPEDVSDEVPGVEGWLIIGRYVA